MFAYTCALLERVRVDRKGVTAMDYGVIAAGVVLVGRHGSRHVGNEGFHAVRFHWEQALKGTRHPSTRVAFVA
jgi:hypothetical protein